MTTIAQAALPEGPMRPGHGWRRPAAAALLVVVLGVATLIIGPELLAVAAVVGVVAWLSARPARGLAIFCWLLPFHVLVMAGLYGGLGVSATVVRTLAAWKETLFAAVVVATIVHVLLRRRGATERQVTITWVDATVAALLCIATGHLVAAGPWLGSELTFVGKAYAFRDIASFFFLYFVGRVTAHDVADNDATLDRLFTIGVVTAIFGILEYIFVPPEILVAIGTGKYFAEFLNAPEFTAHNALGLPDNYVDVIGGTLVRRAGSTYLLSTGFATALILSIAAASVLVFQRDRRAGPRRALGYVIVWVGLLLSITRMSIVASLVEALVVAFWYRRKGVAVGIVASIVAVGIAAVAVVPGLASFLWETLTFQTPSSLTHVGAWTSAWDIALSHPFGAGLGTADETAFRFNPNQPLTGDNLFFKYSAELGIPAALIHIAALFGIARAGWVAARSGPTPARRRLGITIFALTIGIFINGMTGVVYNSTILAYTYFWLAGSTVTLAMETKGRSARRPP